jgi:hypothetical protein
LRGRALADHDVLSALELGDGILHGAALVVGIDAGGDVGVQVVARKAGGVAVDFFVVRLRGDDRRFGDGFGCDVLAVGEGPRDDDGRGDECLHGQSMCVRL